MKKHTKSLAVGIGVGTVVAILVAFGLFSTETPSSQVTDSFFIGGTVYNVTEDVLTIDRSENQTITDLTEIRLVKGSVFYSQGVIVVTEEVPNKAARGVEVCAHVRPHAEGLSAGKIFLEQTCESFTP